MQINLGLSQIVKPEYARAWDFKATAEGEIFCK